jgi:hypothetical protein
MQFACNKKLYFVIELSWINVILFDPFYFAT